MYENGIEGDMAGGLRTSQIMKHLYTSPRSLYFGGCKQRSDVVRFLCWSDVGMPHGDWGGTRLEAEVVVRIQVRGELGLN